MVIGPKVGHIMHPSNLIMMSSPFILQSNEEILKKILIERVTNPMMIIILFRRKKCFKFCPFFEDMGSKEVIYLMYIFAGVYIEIIMLGPVHILRNT